MDSLLDQLCEMSWDGYVVVRTGVVDGRKQYRVGWRDSRRTYRAASWTSREAALERALAAAKRQRGLE